VQIAVTPDPQRWVIIPPFPPPGWAREEARHRSAHLGVTGPQWRSELESLLNELQAMERQGRFARLMHIDDVAHPPFVVDLSLEIAKDDGSKEGRRATQRHLVAALLPEAELVRLRPGPEKGGEPPHPHVHLCVLVRNQFGDRLNPRKNDLFEWRVRFAEKLREEGVQCAATRRQHRGITQKPEKGVFRAIKSRGQVPNRYRQQAEELIEAVKHNERPTHQSWKKIMHTRGLIVDEYGKIAKELYKMGHKTEARIISRLAKETAAQPRDTKAQQQFDAAVNNGMTAEKLTQNLKHQLDESEQFSNLARKLSESGHKAEAKLMQDIAVAAAGRSIVGETLVERSNTQSAENPSLHHEHGDEGLTR